MTRDADVPVELLRSPLPPLSEATRASLQAVRRAQEVARERARRETMRARIGAGMVVGAIALGVIVLGPPVKRRLIAARAASAATTPPPVAGGGTSGARPSSATTAESVAAPAAAPLEASAPNVAAPAPGPVETRASGAGAARPAARASAGASPAQAATGPLPDDSTCAETFAQHRWQISIDECTRLFEARPQDGALALRIAHAHYARGHVPEAGTWAGRAVALDPTLAEGFVLVARAEARAGHADASVEAYRQYLTLAPRGWHSAEARKALR